MRAISKIISFKISIKINLKLRPNFKKVRRGRIETDYSTPLLDLLIKCELDHYDKNKINEQNFPITSEKRLQKLSIRLFHRDVEISTAKIIRDMNLRGYRPATLYEMLVFAVKYPNLVKRFGFFVALGSKFFDPNDESIITPSLMFFADMKMLAFRNWDSNWSNRYFIGVRHLKR